MDRVGAMSKKKMRNNRLHSDGENVGAAAPNVPAIVGGNLRRLRKGQGYSLERLSSLSGVSRAMLGQIETGKSAPTVSLLWKIADALNLPVVHLIARPEAARVSVLRKDDGEVLTSVNGHFVTRNLLPPEGEARAEFLEVRIAARHTERAKAAPVSGRKTIVVARGALRITVDGAAPIELVEGDVAAFDGHLAHTYENIGDDTAIAYVVVNR
jgi:transcriptional regulator with XRE-family HTH domain